MAKKPTKLPSLTSLEAIKEALDVRLGRRGDKLDQAVTFRDLGESGGFEIRRSGGDIISAEYKPGRNAPLVPEAVQGLKALPVFGGINLLWDPPTYGYSIGYAEVFRSETPGVDARYLLSVEGGNMHLDLLDGAAETLYYYWVRFVGVNGRKGPISAAVSAMALPLVSDVTERLTGELDESHLAERLNSRLDLIDGLGAGSVAARISATRETLESSDQALAEQIDTVQAAVGGNVAALQQEQSTRANADSALAEQIDTAQAQLGEDVAAVQTRLTAEVEYIGGELVALGAGYTAQVQANGLIGGFGIYNDGTRVDAAFDVDRFWIGRTSEQQRKPFMVVDGVTYIDTAMVREASIQEGQLGAITIGKLERADGTPVTTVAGLIRADAIDADKLHVAAAARFSGDVYSDSWAKGDGGWYLGQDGRFEVRSATSGGRMEMRDNVLKVFDDSGRLRIKIGNLAV